MKIGYARATVFDLEPFGPERLKYINWLIGQAVTAKVKVDALITTEAIALLSERLTTPLQFEQYLTRAFEEAYKIGRKPVGTDIVEGVLLPGCRCTVQKSSQKLERHANREQSLGDVGLLDSIACGKRDRCGFAAAAMVIAGLLRNGSEQPSFLRAARYTLFAAYRMHRHVQGRGKRRLDVDSCRLVALRLDLEVVDCRSVRVGLSIVFARDTLEFAAIGVGQRETPYSLRLDGSIVGILSYDAVVVFHYYFMHRIPDLVIRRMQGQMASRFR